MHLSVLDLVPVRSDQTTGDALAASGGWPRWPTSAATALLGGRAPQHARRRRDQPAGADRDAGRRDRAHPGGLGRRDAAQPRAAGGRRAVRAARGGPPRPDRPRHRPCPRLGPGHLLGAAPRRRRGRRRGGLALPVVRRQRDLDDEPRRGRPPGPGPDAPAAPRPRAATSVADVWLLGSSDYSARLAAEKGLPYVFAHHFSGHGTAEALELYRSTFRPSEALAEPRTFLTVNAVVAPTARGGRAAGAAQPALDGGPAHRRPAGPAAHRRGGRDRPAPRGAPVPGRVDARPLGRRHRRRRPPSRCTSWPRRTTSTR